jgi:hypothetical protein
MLLKFAQCVKTNGDKVCASVDMTVARLYLDLRFSHGFVNEYNADPIIILYILWGLMVLLAT